MLYILKWKVNQSGSDYEYIGPRAKAEWAAVCSTSSPPIETEGGEGTAGGHWDEECFGNELMTGYLESGENASNPLSRITVAALEDIGYGISYDTADNNFQVNQECCNPPNTRSLLRMKPSRSAKENQGELSTSLYEIAAQQAAKELKKNRDNAPPHIPTGLKFVGGDFITIMVRDENGHIRDKFFQWHQVSNRL